MTTTDKTAVQIAAWMHEAGGYWEGIAEACAADADGDDGEARRMFAKLAEEYYAKQPDLLGQALAAIDWEEIAEHFTATACEAWRQFQAEEAEHVTQRGDQP